MDTSCVVNGVEQRIHSLVTYFQDVQQHRMKDVPLLNHALHVEAVEFVCVTPEEVQQAIVQGVLITPWFMSLCRLPLVYQEHDERIGHSFVHAFGLERFDFIGAYDPVLGYYETCALFSPMFDFPTQDLARDTARAALKEIRQGATPASDATSEKSPAMPSRRAFFLRPSSLRGTHE